jgi:hypothetical protein
MHTAASEGLGHRAAEDCSANENSMTGQMRAVTTVLSKSVFAPWRRPTMQRASELRSPSYEISGKPFAGDGGLIGISFSR